jgi:hypothetical protein
MTDNVSKDPLPAPALPVGFGLENEHPMLTMPFSLHLGNKWIEGKRISVTEIEVAAPKETVVAGKKELATLSFPFDDLAINLTAEVTGTDRGNSGTCVVLFSEPTGAHLGHLRYILNSYIAGDLITLKGLMSYSGPTQPKPPKAAEKKSVRDRVRSIGLAMASLIIALFAGSVVFSRYTSSYELYPVFIDRAGLTMQATVAGQVIYLNPDAADGEVAYSIASTTGDVLSFQMPRHGEVILANEIFEGATVLPTDLILTILDDTSELRLRTMISIEGLTRALQGDPVTIELSDGRSLPATINVRDSTRAATLQGDLFVPVDLTVKDGSLGLSDTKKSARLRLSKTLLGAIGLGEENGQ